MSRPPLSVTDENIRVLKEQLLHYYMETPERRAKLAASMLHPARILIRNACDLEEFRADPQVTWARIVSLLETMEGLLARCDGTEGIDLKHFRSMVGQLRISRDMLLSGPNPS